MRGFSKILFIIVLACLFGLIFYLWHRDVIFSSSAPVVEKQPVAVRKLPEKKDRIEKINITEGSTYGSLMATSGVDYALGMEIYSAAKPVYDLVKIRVGRVIELVYDKDSDKLKELRYKVDSEEELFVTQGKRGDSASTTLASTTLDREELIWQAELRPIPYEIKNKLVSGVVKSSMYQAALDNDIDIRAIIELANAFQWTIDFAMDTRVGDTFKFIFEERYLDGEYIMPANVLAGEYINDGKKYEVYFFKENEDNIGYFDQDGNSVQKMFLKAPVAFKYISSGYTTSPRYVSAFKKFTSSHRAIDYAAAIGTPVRSVGNGTVTFAGRNGPYGNFLSIRHNGTYSTNYAHLSRFAVKYGQKVSQGQVIGYVGSTGFSTGPHLHFEMLKNGVKINPLREVLPPGKAIKEENKERFFSEVEKYRSILKGS